MCGRYVSVAEKAALLEQFQATAVDDQELAPDYNVAPGKKVYAVMQRSRDDEPEPLRRELRELRWGLIPSWAKDPKIGNRMINARLETAGEKPSFRAAYARRRCVLPAAGFYEWQTREQPYYLYAADESILALAGLYEIWRDPELNPEDPESLNGLKWTCTILTTNATDSLGKIHDRAPLIVRDEDLSDWLDPLRKQPPVEALIPAAPGCLRTHRVSMAVNSVRNNGPELIVAV